MAGFESTEWIARAPEEVFGFLTDSANAPRVVRSVVRVEKLTDGPVVAAVVRAGGLKKAIVPMVVSILKKEDGDHLQRLKAALESR